MLLMTNSLLFYPLCQKARYYVLMTGSLEVKLTECQTEKQMIGWGLGLTMLNC